MGDLFGFKMVMILPIFQMLGIVMCIMVVWAVRTCGGVGRGQSGESNGRCRLGLHS